MDKAKLKKEEQLILEDKVFNKGQNWKPKITTPIEPKLSAYISKPENSQIKSLSKPVNPMNMEMKVSVIMRSTDNSKEDEFLESS